MVVYICEHCRRAKATNHRLCEHCVELIQDKQDLDEMARLFDADLLAIMKAFRQFDED